MTTAGSGRSGEVGGGRAFDNPREWVKGDVAGREGMKGMREGDERDVGALDRWIVDGCMCYVYVHLDVYRRQ